MKKYTTLKKLLLASLLSSAAALTQAEQLDSKTVTVSADIPASVDVSNFPTSAVNAAYFQNSSPQTGQHDEPYIYTNISNLTVTTNTPVTVTIDVGIGLNSSGTPLSSGAGRILIYSRINNANGDYFENPITYNLAVGEHIHNVIHLRQFLPEGATSLADVAAGDYTGQMTITITSQSI